MYIKNLLVLTVFSALLFSCKKDESVTPDNNNSIAGTWTFVNMTGHTNNTQISVENGNTYKNVSISDYTSINNTGEMTIDAGTMTNTNFTYTADTQVYGTSYINGVSQGTLSAPYTFTAPVSSSSIPYKLISKDSMYLSVGTVTTGGTTVPSTAAGFKIAWSGDTLLLKSGFLQGTSAYMDYATQTMRYIRK
jgi:hypothetical protein